MKRGRKKIEKFQPPQATLFPTNAKLEPPPDPPMPAIWQGRIKLSKYKFPNFIQTCGVEVYGDDIRQWLLTHDAYVTEENFAVIGKQIKNYYKDKKQGQMSLLPHSI